MLVETKFLKPVAKATVPARTKPFNVAEFYQKSNTRTGLDVRDMFLDRFVCRTVASAPERSYVALALKENVDDEDIHKELSEMPLSRLEDIAALIVAQPVTLSGFLLNDGYANIFLVEGKPSEVVGIYIDRCDNDFGWVISDRRHSWSVDGYRRWRHDCRVFCPGTTAL